MAKTPKALIRILSITAPEKIEALRLLENEIRIKMIISNEVFIGVDTEEDLTKAIKLINEKKSL